MAVAALKAAFDDLLQQVTKHKDLLRNQHQWPRRRREPGVRQEPQVPFEQTLAAVHAPIVSSEDIGSYINANLHRLQRFVDRELRFRENADQFAPDSWRLKKS